MPDLHAYTGAEERIYSAYLAVAPDGTTTTLIGTPGMEPVGIRKAGGAGHGGEPLPDVPGDGSWVPVGSPVGDASPSEDKTKTRKTS